MSCTGWAGGGEGGEGWGEEIGRVQLLNPDVYDYKQWQVNKTWDWSHSSTVASTAWHKAWSGVSCVPPALQLYSDE